MSSTLQTILVADDDPAARLLMQAALEQFGFAVSLAVDGDDALRQFRANPCAMVMLDVDMPGIDGYQVCAAIRAEAGDELPIVMVTGMDGDESVKRAYDAGATDFIAKPINWPLLGHRVKYLFRSNLAMRELSTANARNAALLDAIPDLMFEIDLEGRFLGYHSPRSDLLAAAPESFIGRTAAEVLPADAATVCLSALRETDEQGFSVGKQYQLQLPQGSRWFELSVSRKRSESGQLPTFIALARDITERRRAEEKLRLAASVFTHSREGIMITDADGTIIDVNEAYCRISGSSRDQLLGLKRRQVDPLDQEAESQATRWDELKEKGYWHGELWKRRQSGEAYAVMQTISAVRDAHGNVQHYVVLFSDITRLKAHESRLRHIAHHDMLTMLPNRVLLADRLHQAMAQEPRRGQRLAVAYLDLDGFKAINDDHGHETGDQFLMTVANRMKQTLREGDTLARLGGDEFAVVLLDLPDVAASLPMLDRLLAAAAQPAQIDDVELQVSASIGVTFYPQAEDVDADQLLRQADQAMYQAKQAGKSRYHLFDAEQDCSVRGHNESIERIRRALAAREFVVHYQPKVNMRSGTVIGAEALIRWQHPEKGLVLPAAFLPLIDDHPLSVELGEWAITSVLTQMRRWRAAGLELPVSVNVGARQLQQADFVERLHGLLAEHAEIGAGDLQIEVLETGALHDLARVSRVIESCRAIGVSFALDDFGTGYSSLTYLKRLAVDQLKIDRSFVRHVLDDPDDLAILQGVLGLASALRRQVIAEGVETVAHGQMLLLLGCELAQGYGIARPMPAAELPGWAAAWRPDPAWVDRPALSHDDFPLLLASVELRACITAFEDFLKGERDTPPPLDHRQCRCGLWLNAPDQARYGAQPAFVGIGSLHRQVHAVGGELHQLRASGRDAEARARLNEFQGLRDALRVQLGGIGAAARRRFGE
jgi:diguanylate cyclase (GGDEF)-like protein/PAS domain S-box-containing protein